MHVTYNVPAIKMYLLDLFIRDASGGQRDVTAFVRALWSLGTPKIKVIEASRMAASR